MLCFDSIMDVPIGLDVHPCSHVAHIFRSNTPYSWGGDVASILKKNHVRVAEVWLDDYKQFCYERIGYNLVRNVSSFICNDYCPAIIFSPFRPSV